MLAGVVVIGDVVAMLLLAVEAAGVGVGGVTTPRGEVGLPHRRKATSPAGAPCTDARATQAAGAALLFWDRVLHSHQHSAKSYAESVCVQGQHRLRFGPDKACWGGSMVTGCRRHTGLRRDYAQGAASQM